jgi:hypothetical protein
LDGYASTLKRPPAHYPEGSRKLGTAFRSPTAIGFFRTRPRWGRRSWPIPSLPRITFAEPVRSETPRLALLTTLRGGSASRTRSSVPATRSQRLSELSLPVRVLPPPDRSAQLGSSPGSLPGRSTRFPFAPRKRLSSNSLPAQCSRFATLRPAHCFSQCAHQPACSARAWHPNCLNVQPSLFPIAFGDRLSPLRLSSPLCSVEAGVSKRTFAHPRRPSLSALPQRGQRSRPISSPPRSEFPESVRSGPPLLSVAGEKDQRPVPVTQYSTKRYQPFVKPPLPVRVLPLSDRSAQLPSGPDS